MGFVHVLSFTYNLAVGRPINLESAEITGFSATPKMFLEFFGGESKKPRSGNLDSVWISSFDQGE